MSIRSLNILMSYPVNWSAYKVFRDYIQNFFDAVEPENFSKKFRYDYNEETKTLTLTEDEVFDKEWLFYVGTSTKRNRRRKYAGKFGEGFKIASLVAYRDMKYEIQAESKDWVLKVTESKKLIESKEVSCLAYDIGERKYVENSVLVLKGVSKEGYDTFLRAIKDFYYIGNPRIGREFFHNGEMALYETALEQDSKKPHGYIYVGYQMRKYLELPLVVCHHSFTIIRDDRDRDYLYTYEAQECITDVINILNAEQSYAVLVHLEGFWNGRAARHEDISPGIIIRNLIKNIQGNSGVVNLFNEKFSRKYVADIAVKALPWRRRTALAWFRLSDYYVKRKVILNDFTALGIFDIEKMCEEENGFEILGTPNTDEIKYIKILMEASAEFFSDIYQFDKLPECKIILNDEATVEGTAHLVKTDKVKTNNYGLKTRSEIQFINIKKSILNSDDFGRALSVTLHELLHQYGGDSSIQFHKALLLMNRRMLEVATDLVPYHKRWKEEHNAG